MLSAISRYGARVLPDTEQRIAAARARGELITGPQIAEFERAFERRAGRGTAISTAYGRMAFYYMLQALDLPPGAEIILPALTFWVVPELARAAGLTVVFADVDPATFKSIPIRSSGSSPARRASWCRRTSTACPATWIGFSTSRRGTS
jgi:dTDP-4-amino-4,6-dideoxygalactose transaminase